jgi:hypothetical protein
MKRIIIVALLSLLSVALWAPDMARPFGHPLGTPGFSVGSGGRVLSVDSGSSAARAGIEPGQRVDWQRTPLQTRLLLVGASFQNLHPIQRFTVHMVTGTGAFTALVSSEAESRADLLTVLPRGFFQLLLLFAGIALVLMRPSKATWGFFIYSLFGPGAPINEIFWWGPPQYQIATTLLVSLALPIVAVVASFVFALHLLHEEPLPRWRRVVEWLVCSIAAVTIVMASWRTVDAVFGGVSLTSIDYWILILETVVTLSVPLILLLTYSGSTSAVRERLRWVVFGFSVNAVILSFVNATSQEVTLVAVPYWLFAALSGVDTVAVAFTVLYAVLKHHVIDINVAISRALVYTILSAAIVGVFTLVDAVFTRAVSSRNTGLMVDIGLALVLGMFFNTLHRRIDLFVDNLLFKHRHLAEKHLHTVIRGMPFALSEQQVDAMVVEEPRRSFDLCGAALLGDGDNGDFIVRYSAGAPLGIARISSEDPLQTYLQGERCALRLNEHGWPTHAIAIPIFSHGDLAAVAIYGLHNNGTDFDAEEIALFEQVAQAAGNAYDRLEAKSLRERVRELDLLLNGALAK